MSGGRLLYVIGETNLRGKVVGSLTTVGRVSSPWQPTVQVVILDFRHAVIIFVDHGAIREVQQTFINTAAATGC